jgi:hypothetical protein
MRFSCVNIDPPKSTAAGFSALAKSMLLERARFLPRCRKAGMNSPRRARLLVS